MHIRFLLSAATTASPCLLPISSPFFPRVCCFSSHPHRSKPSVVGVSSATTLYAWVRARITYLVCFFFLSMRLCLDPPFLSQHRFDCTTTTSSPASQASPSATRPRVRAHPLSIGRVSHRRSYLRRGRRHAVRRFFIHTSYSLKGDVHNRS